MFFYCTCFSRTNVFLLCMDSPFVISSPRIHALALAHTDNRWRRLIDDLFVENSLQIFTSGQLPLKAKVYHENRWIDYAKENDFSFTTTKQTADSTEKQNRICWWWIALKLTRTLKRTKPIKWFLVFDMIGKRDNELSQSTSNWHQAMESICILIDKSFIWFLCVFVFCSILIFISSAIYHTRRLTGWIQSNWSDYTLFVRIFIALRFDRTEQFNSICKRAVSVTHT